MGDYDEVEVLSRFTGAWAGGFEVHEVADAKGEETQFLVRRRSDGTVIPEWFTADEIRPPQTARDVVVDDEWTLLTEPPAPVVPPTT